MILVKTMASKYIIIDLTYSYLKVIDIFIPQSGGWCEFVLGAREIWKTKIGMKMDIGLKWYPFPILYVTPKRSVEQNRIQV